MIEYDIGVLVIGLTFCGNNLLLFSPFTAFASFDHHTSDTIVFSVSTSSIDLTATQQLRRQVEEGEWEGSEALVAKLCPGKAGCAILGTFSLRMTG